MSLRETCAVWKSRALEKIRRDEPVLCGKQNVISPRITEIVGSCGLDRVWLCMEHSTGDYAAVEECIRAGKVYGMDTMVRVAKTGYPDVIRPLEVDAAGIMYPHCRDADEARKIVEMAKFPPLGKRAVDGGSVDGQWCKYPLKEYFAHVNAHRFLCVQIEDVEAIEHVEPICAVEGIDIVFVGPGDLSAGLGDPGNIEHPEIVGLTKRVAAACAENG